MIYELLTPVTANIHGEKHSGTIVGRTFENEPHYDVMLDEDRKIVSNIHENLIEKERSDG